MDEEKDLNEDQASGEEDQADETGEDSQNEGGAESSDASESGEEETPRQR